MAERKSIMFALSDTIVALPGGLGTFDELLEALTLFQLSAHRVRIGLVNANGFFGPFIEMVHHLIDEGFLEEKGLQYFTVRNTSNELLDALVDSKAALAESAANLAWTSKP
jgi:uncharacterized protein (TIGR00730 family)